MPDKGQSIEFSREELYQKVWTTPMVQLAQEFGLSDVGLAKICKKYHIPIPPRGHWAKKQYGKHAPPPPLPAINDPGGEQIRITKASESPDEDMPPEFHSLIAAEMDPAQKIVVPEQLQSPHRLVVATKRCFARTDRSVDIPEEPVPLKISVSKRNLDRALRIMDALIKELEKRGHSVATVKERWRFLTQVTILGQKVDIRLRERDKQIPHELTADEKRSKEKGYNFHTPKWDLESTDTLELQIQSEWGETAKKSWVDGKKHRLEDQLNAVIVGLVQEAGKRKAWWSRHYQWKKECEERERLRVQEEEKQKKEEARFQTLLKEAENWEKSQTIRKYIEAVREYVMRKYGTIDPDSQADQWIKWAIQQADRLDPLVLNEA